MLAFIPAPVVDRIGWLLVHSLWQFTLIVALVMVLLRLMRRSPANVRYWLCLVSLGAMTVAPAVTWSLLPADLPASRAILNRQPTPVHPTDAALSLFPAVDSFRPRPEAPAPAAHSEVVLVEPVLGSAPPREVGERAKSWWASFEVMIAGRLQELVAVWCLGVLLFSLRPAWSWHTLRRLKRVGVSHVPETVTNLLDRAAAGLLVRREVRVLQSKLVRVPMVVGYLRPVILLPLSVVSGLSTVELTAILAHELAHVRRHDFLVNLAQTLVETLFFYHPAVWWLSSRIRQEREQCCDELAATVLGSRVDYGRALLALEELRGAAPVLSLGARGPGRGRGRGGSLLTRIRRLTAAEPTSHTVGQGGLVLVTLLVALLSGIGLWSATHADEVSPPSAPFANESLDEIRMAGNGQLLLKGQILLADGLPAVNATVASLNQWNRGEVTVSTNQEGQFELTDGFGFGCKIHVRSADGRQQITWSVPAIAARTTFATPMRITLMPAIEHVVLVKADDQPIAGVSVVAVGFGSSFHELAVTGSDGRATLQIPSTEQLDRISVWHPTQGVSGKKCAKDEQLPATTELELLPTAPHVIRFVDPAGRAVPDLPFGVSVNTKQTEYMLIRQFAAAHLKSGDDGSVVIDWFPAEFLYVDIDLSDDAWMIDEIVQADATSPSTVVNVRPKRTVKGRLAMPEGTSAEGLLIRASSFGPGRKTDLAAARARSDGTFTLSSCSDHVYFVSVTDMEWASDEWTGVILPTEESDPAEISIPVYAAAPVEFRVTRGSSQQPVPNTWVYFSRSQSVEWRDSHGEEQRGTSGMGGWLRTDSQGLARAGLGRGFYSARIVAGDWEQQTSFRLANSDPQRIEFHRPWDSERSVSVRLLTAGAPFRPTAKTLIRAWGINETMVQNRAGAVSPVMQPDGSFRLSMDAEEICAFVHDPDNHVSGFVAAGPEQDSVDVSLQATGTYAGRLVDDQGRPLAGLEVAIRLMTDRKIRLPKDVGYFLDWTRGPDISVAEAQFTAADGRFRFTDVPSDMPLQFRVVQSDGPTGYVSRPDHFLLTPGEDREGAVVTFRYHNSSDDEAVRPLAPPTPLAVQLADIVRNARVSGMHVLAVLEGDESPHVAALSRQAVDYNANPEVLKTLTLKLRFEDQQRDAEFLNQKQWPQPQAGEVALVAINGQGDILGSVRLSAIDEPSVKESSRTATNFIALHVPPTRDARQAFEEAKRLAAETNRRIWLISGGPHCGPCFALARWIDEQHELLEKEYVIVKVGVGDHGSDEVMQPYEPSGGIPWHVIVDAGGHKLITSEGPLGNIGYPSDTESIRHFRTMLDQSALHLTEDERTQLMQSLESGE